MSFLDFNNAEKQTGGDLIPADTIVPVHMTLRPGGAGQDGYLKATKTGEALMLDCEFTVIEGPHAKRKFWGMFLTEGTTDGQKKAADIARGKLRAMLESARGVNPADESPAAIEKRKVGSFEEFDGLRFVAMVGIERGKDGYQDKNILKAVITPDSKEWAQLEQVKKPAASKPATGATGAAPVGNKPSWAA
jgi:hypothetical protein